MKLRRLSIAHTESYSSSPSGNKYEGSMEFFTQKGEALKIILTEEQLQGIVNLFGDVIVAATKDAAQSIIASVRPSLQIESTQP